MIGRLGSNELRELHELKLIGNRVAAKCGAAVVLWGAAGLAGCDGSEAAPPPRLLSALEAPLTRGPERGVYGFDGTDVTAESGSAVASFVGAASAGRKRYFPGTTLDARTYSSIVAAGVTEICGSDEELPFDEVFLVGYSRGAVAALEVAARLATDCARPVPVRWVGLVDAVASLVEDSLRVGIAGRNIIETRCVHLVKTYESIPFLGTAAVPSCARTEIEGNHLEVGRSARTIESLRRDTARIAPALFGFADPTDRCAQPTDVRDCLARRCVWENAACKAAP